MIQISLKQEAERFLKNLQWQLEDLEFEQRHRHEGRELRLYFDTADLHGAALGMHAFYSAEGRFLAEKFKRDRALIHCLAASRWLGPIHMLPPHQAEFLSLINIGFGVGVDNDPKGSARRFLRDVKALAGEEDGAAPLEELSEVELIKFVRSHARAHARLAINAFKFTMSIRGTWQTRLVNWREHGTLVVSKERGIKYDELINSTEFHRLKHIFDEARSDRAVNNFADAVAIMLLVRMVRDFNAGDGHILPRFFVSSSLFREAVEKADLAEELSYKDADGRSVSVMRDDDYFVFKATLLPPPEVTPPAQGQANFFNDPEALRSVRDRLSEILRAREPLGADAEQDEGSDSLTRELDQITIQDKRLRQVISEIKSFSFLESVWMPFSLENDVRHALKALGEAADQLDDQKFRSGVDEAIKATKRELEESALAYERVSMLWNDLQVVAAGLRKAAGVSDPRGLDVFRVFGLLRFDLPRETHEPIRHLLDALLSNNPRKEKAALRAVITAFYARRVGGEADPSRLAEASAVLWALKQHDHLIALLKENEPLPHHSLLMVYAAALLERLAGDESVAHARAVIGRYEALYEQAEEPRQRAAMAVGLGYLYYHLWYGLHYSAPWRSLLPIPADGAEGEGQELINKAINYARRAFDLLPAQDMQKKLYALNQYLYYLVEGGGDERRDEMVMAANTLIFGSYQHDLWQYRFSDTLARFFHREADAFARDESEWQKNLDKAEDYSKKARNGSPGDPVADTYQDMIHLTRIRGFRNGRPSPAPAGL